MSNLLIVFVKNVIPGKVKTRIAQHTGDEEAAKIYSLLLEKTKSVVIQLEIDKRISYHSSIKERDLWEPQLFQKKLQKGVNLGEKMYRDFLRAFDDGYDNVVLMGSDIYDISPDIINEAYDILSTHGCVLGPAKDGGYYLIGFKNDQKNLLEIFRNIPWSTSEVLEDTVKKLKENNISFDFTTELNDVDTVDDIPEDLKRKLQSLAVINN